MAEENKTATEVNSELSALLNVKRTVDTTEMLHLAISYATELLNRCVNIGEQEEARTILRTALVEYADRNI